MEAKDYTQEIESAVQDARKFADANGIKAEYHIGKTTGRFWFLLDNGASLSVGPCENERLAFNIREMTSHVADLYRRGVFGGPKLRLAGGGE